MSAAVASVRRSGESWPPPNVSSRYARWVAISNSANSRGLAGGCGACRDELLEQPARTDESPVQLGRNCRVGRGGGVERAQPPTVVGIELHQAGDHRCDQVFRRTAQDLIEERVLGVREQFGRHLREPVEVAVEDGARQARPRHDITDGQGCERPVEQ